MKTNKEHVTKAILNLCVKTFHSPVIVVGPEHTMNKKELYAKLNDLLGDEELAIKDVNYVSSLKIAEHANGLIDAAGVPTARCIYKAGEDDFELWLIVPKNALHNKLAN